jgi:hypothetical protein
MVGGGHGSSETGVSGSHKDAAAFDPATDTWRTLPDAPVPFQGSGRYGDVAVNGMVIAFDTADPNGRVLVLDPTTGAWRFAPASNRPELTDSQELAVAGRREAPVVSTGRSALVWGGGVASAEAVDGGMSALGCCRAVGEGVLFAPPLVGTEPG